VLQQSGRFLQAIRCHLSAWRGFETLVKRSEAAISLQHMARAFLQLNLADSALRSLRCAREILSIVTGSAGAVARFDEGLGRILQVQVGPTDLLELLRLGDEARSGGQWEDALTWYDAYAALHPLPSPPDPREQTLIVAVYMNRRYILTKLGRIDEALDQCRLILSLEPLHADTLFNYGELLIQKGGVEEGLRCLAQAADLEPANDLFLSRCAYHLIRAECSQNLAVSPKVLGAGDRAAKAWLQTGAGFLRQENFQDAITALRLATRCAPAMFDAWYLLGRGHAGNDDAPPHATARAIVAFEEAAKIDSSHADIYYLLGVCHERISGLDAAERHYRQAVALQPAHADALNNLAAVCIRGERFQEAADFARRATELAPSDSHPWINLGQCLCVQGDLSAAHRAFSKAHELDPDDPRPVLGMRRVEERTAAGGCQESDSAKSGDLSRSHGARHV
jgi:tetratricopeptide (TPR) repeat protein